LSFRDQRSGRETNKVLCLEQDFLAAKLVNMITYAEDGSTRSRLMTNFNEDPRSKMRFLTYSTTRG